MCNMPVRVFAHSRHRSVAWATAHKCDQSGAATSCADVPHYAWVSPGRGLPVVDMSIHYHRATVLGDRSEHG